MIRAVCIATALLFAAPALAQDEQPQKTDTTKSKPSSAKDKKGAKGKDAKPAKPTHTSAAAKTQPATAAKDPNFAERTAAKRAKSVFLFAMDACERPERCDAALRDDAETQFVAACRACASNDKCEAERVAIREGHATNFADPCAQ
jgi:hypothetical protein